MRQQPRNGPSAAEISETLGSAPWNPTLRDHVRWVWNAWRGHRWFLPLLIIFTLVSSGVAIAYPLVFRYVLDSLATFEGQPPLRHALQILAAIAVGRVFAGYYPWARAWVNLRIDSTVRLKIFGSIQDKDHAFFTKFRTGDLSTRLMDDIAEYPKLSWFCCSGVFRAMESGSKLIFCLGVMFWLSAKLSLLAILPLPFMLWLIYLLRMKLREAFLAQQEAISETNDSLESAFTGIRILKAFTAETEQSRRFDDVLDRRVSIQFRVKQLFAVIQVLNRVASRVGQLVVLGYGGALLSRGEVTLGTLYAIYTYLDMLVDPMIDLPNLFVTSRQAFVCIDREEEVLRFPTGSRAAGAGNGSNTSADAATRGAAPVWPAAPDVSPVAPHPSRAGLLTVSLQNISMSYEPGRPVLQDITLNLKAGEKVAIVGEIGSGKSTLLHMLAGLIRPDVGALRINEQDIDSLPWTNYRSYIGFVPQQSLLFSETIEENICLGREQEEGMLDRVLEISGMRSEIQAMPKGLNTLLGQKGTRISGGQRQRLSIARALYNRPQFLLLDDCTASLDAANEDRLWTGIDELIPGAIVVLVSHRLATIRRADRIVIMDAGRVSDVGTHEELEKQSGLYREYLRHKESVAS